MRSAGTGNGVGMMDEGLDEVGSARFWSVHHAVR